MRVFRGVFAVLAVVVPALVPVVAEHPAAAATSTPRLTVGDVSVAEGDGGKVVVHVPIDLDRAAPVKLYVSWQITGGGATGGPATLAGVDFVAPKSGVRVGKSAIAAGKTEAFVSITIFGDTGFEPDETVNLDVTSAPGTDVVGGHGTLTIVNDDSPPSSRAATADATIPRVSIGVPSISEGNWGLRHAPVPVTLSFPAPGPISVSFQTPGTDTTAAQSCDDPRGATISPVTKTLNFKTGQQSLAVNVPVLGNTGIDEAVRSIADSATVVSGSATIDQPTSDIVLRDDDNPDAPVTPPPGAYRVSEPAGGADPTFPPVVAKLTGCGYPQSTAASISGDGRFVAFTSNADNLVGNDTNAESDVFVKDTWTGAMERVSVAADGTQAGGASDATTISVDGRYVIFDSYAQNLVPGPSGYRDAYLKDRVTGDIERLGSDTPGAAGSWGGSISADDRYVAFTSDAPLTGGSPGNRVFLLDRTTNGISLVSTGANTYGYYPAISGDGLHVAFLGTDALGRGGVLVKDLDTGHLELVSVNNAGQPGTGISANMPAVPGLSYDGQVVAFNGQYCNMGLPSWFCGNGTGVYGAQTWVRDRVAHTTTLASVATDGTPASGVVEGPSLSSDGRYTVFDTNDTGSFTTVCPQPGTSGGGSHVYQRDLSAGTTQQVDLIPAVQCPSTSYPLSGQAMSTDGSFVVYTSIVYDGDVSASNPEAVFVTRLR